MNSELDQVLYTVDVPIELYINISYTGEWYPTPVIEQDVPYMVQIWLESQVVREFVLSPKEGPMLPQRVTRTMSFEVFLDVNSQGKAYRADCQTDCPGFMAAWIEQEAIKRYNTGVYNETIPSI